MAKTINKHYQRVDDSGYFNWHQIEMKVDDYKRLMGHISNPFSSLTYGIVTELKDLLKILEAQE
jgi:hypothetical protein